MSAASFTPSSLRATLQAEPGKYITSKEGGGFLVDATSEKPKGFFSKVGATFSFTFKSKDEKAAIIKKNQDGIDAARNSVVATYGEEAGERFDKEFKLPEKGYLFVTRASRYEKGAALSTDAFLRFADKEETLAINEILDAVSNSQSEITPATAFKRSAIYSSWGESARISNNDERLAAAFKEKEKTLSLAAKKMLEDPDIKDVVDSQLRCYGGDNKEQLPPDGYPRLPLRSSDPKIPTDPSRDRVFEKVKSLYHCSVDSNVANLKASSFIAVSSRSSDSERPSQVGVFQGENKPLVTVTQGKAREALANIEKVLRGAKKEYGYGILGKNIDSLIEKEIKKLPDAEKDLVMNLMSKMKEKSTRDNASSVENAKISILNRSDEGFEDDIRGLYSIADNTITSLIAVGFPKEDITNLRSSVALKTVKK